MFDLCKKGIAFLLISEFLLTTLGFCGHTHDPAHEGDSRTGYHFHLFEQASHENTHTRDHDVDHTHQNEHCKKKCRCACYGGFIGDIQLVTIRIYLDSFLYTSSEVAYYEHAWYPFVYHPPKNHA